MISWLMIFANCCWLRKNSCTISESEIFAKPRSHCCRWLGSVRSCWSRTIARIWRRGRRGTPIRWWTRAFHTWHFPSRRCLLLRRIRREHHPELFWYRRSISLSHSPSRNMWLVNISAKRRWVWNFYLYVKYFKLNVGKEWCKSNKAC
jgi:hypothetical protein